MMNTNKKIPTRPIRFIPCLLSIILLSSFPVSAASWNGYSMERYTAETPHFRIYYHKGIEHLVKPVADKFESLYAIYEKTYGCKLPSNTRCCCRTATRATG